MYTMSSLAWHLADRNDQVIQSFLSLENYFVYETYMNENDIWSELKSGLVWLVIWPNLAQLQPQLVW